jgi:hypothetical protein
MMAFPLTHLLVAHAILESRPLPRQDGAQFLLGSISPDAVHYREEFTGDGKAKIGPTKKITHLCPVSAERWGQVTDNNGWVSCVKNFLREHPNDSFAAGYAVHALTDIYNNLTIWDKFRTNHPDEAAKGYTSGYYIDLRHIDTQLYFEYEGVAEIFALLAKAKPVGLDGLVFAEEVNAIQQNLLHEQYADVQPSAHKCEFVTLDDTLAFIKSAADFCI